MRRLRGPARAGALLVLSVAMGPACRPPPALPASAPSRLLRDTMPELDRPTLAGTRLDTRALRGKVIVVEFFAEYCAPCRRTLPEIERLHRRGGDEVVVIGIAEDPYPGESEALVRALGLTFPVVYDAGHVLAGRFRVTEIPSSFVVDRQGIVRWASGAGTEPGDLARAVAALR